MGTRLEREIKKGEDGMEVAIRGGPIKPGEIRAAILSVELLAPFKREGLERVFKKLFANAES